MQLSNITWPYYYVKPLIPRRVQILLRSWLAARKCQLCKDIWPIDRTAGRMPEGWRGWPDNKRFALVLTHDVDTFKGHEKCHSLMHLEETLGFRSSFNFVAAEYRVSHELRRQLAEHGFEIGIHGLVHKRDLYKSKKTFQSHAVHINRYMKAWDSVGFRSPCMYHNLEWISELDISYDASTFDTDPFEPQPEGVGTIFPFCVQGNSPQQGYVELPYTLPQDFTVFVLLKERSIDIWKEKLAWIAERGGMALLNVHPDYMNFDGRPGYDEYPSAYYRDFLVHINARYGGEYWHVLAKDLADFWSSEYRGTAVPGSGEPDKCRVAGEGDGTIMPSGSQGVDMNKQTVDGDSLRHTDYWGLDSTGHKDRAEKELGMSVARKKIWIDLDNSPHVPFFKPIIAELEKSGYAVVVTARDCFQVCGLAELLNVPCKRIGRHYGKNRIAKACGLLIRALQLAPTILRERPVLALSHGSRSQWILAKILRIPTTAIFDYEHARGIPFARPDSVIVPEVIQDSSIGHKCKHVGRYPGIKEDVYVPAFKPQAGILQKLGIDPTEVVVTVRPPATEAHYHRPQSDELFEAAIAHVSAQPRTRIVLLPRNERQENVVRDKWPELFGTGKIIVPAHVVDGLNLIWYSDLVISGGGTMNREAAALGVPVYSIFRGEPGVVDSYLTSCGRLTLIESAEDVRSKIELKKWNRPGKPETNDRPALRCIVREVLVFLEELGHKKPVRENEALT